MARAPQSRPDPLAWSAVPDITAAEGYAVKALYAGTATADQQQLLAKFIEQKLARVDDASFIFDQHGGDRATAYVEGRRSVGLALRRLRDLPEASLRKAE